MIFLFQSLRGQLGKGPRPSTGGSKPLDADTALSAMSTSRRGRASRAGLLQGAWKDRCGSAIIEFALVVPFLVALVLGIIQMSAAFYVHSTMSDAARETARKLAVGDIANASAAQTYALGLLTNWGSGYAVTVTIPDPGNPADTDYIVSISVPLDSAAIVDPFGYLSGTTVSASSTMREET